MRKMPKNKIIIQINMRLKIELYEKLRKEAFDTRTSMNRIVNEAIEKYLEEEE